MLKAIAHEQKRRGSAFLKPVERASLDFLSPKSSSGCFNRHHLLSPNNVFAWLPCPRQAVLSKQYRVLEPSLLLAQRRERIRYFSTKQETPENITSPISAVPPLLSTTDSVDEDRNGKEIFLYRCSPLWELNKYYQKQNITVRGCMKSESVTLKDGRVRWTSTFTCPKTGRVFHSGIFRPEASRDACSIFKGMGSTVERTHRNRKALFYENKRTAVNAAAARALDALRFETNGTLEPRICEEDPRPKISDEISPAKEILDVKVYNENEIVAESREETMPVLYRNSPLWELDEYYRRNLNYRSPISKLMTVEKLGNYYSARFTCPVSDRVFRSSVLIGAENDAQGQTFTDRNGEQLACYKSKSAATSAAAARALDVFRYEAEGTREPRLCVPDPCTTADPRTTPKTEFSMTKDVDDNKAIVQTHIETVAKDKVDAKQQKEDAEDTLFEVSPLDELDWFYTKNHDPNHTSVFDLMESELVSIAVGEHAWTSQFTCPESGRVFQSATLRPEFIRKGDAPFEFGEQEKKRVFYRKKYSSIQAAAARALDVLRFDANGTLEPRLCDEDPLDDGKSFAANGTDEEVVEVDAEGALVANVEKEEEDDVADAFDEEPVQILVKPVEPRVGSVQETAESDADFWDVADNPDELVVVQPAIPQQLGLSPALRVLSSLQGLPSVSRSPAYNATGVLSGSALVESENERINRINDEASVWLDLVSSRYSKPLSHGIHLPRVQSSNDLVIAKALLSALADANLAFQAPRSTQEIATQILSFLSGTVDSRPDTEVYNLFLKCIEGSDPVTRAIKAESVVERMKHQYVLYGFVPPQPDAGSYNALLHIWAQVGGVNGRYTKLGESFRPNRDSFLAILSSSSYPSADSETEDVFDTQFAKQCVERMRKLYANTGDESLKPDTEIYNAPLRWSGGLLWRETRPNTRRIEWDDHRKIFAMGFREYSDSNPLVVNAQRVEEWVKTMSEAGVEPNIESYEAIVQAWVRTGTRYGLERAQALIEEISPQVQVRVQTMHPILAGWLHSKATDGASRILQGLDFLRSKMDQNSKTTLDLDLRFLCLEIASNILQDILRQKNSVNDTLPREATTPTDEGDQFQLPSRCLDLFRKLAHQIRDAPCEKHSILLPMLGGPAILTLTAWGRCANNPMADDVTCERIMNATLSVIDIYETVLRDVAAKEVSKEKVCGALLSEELQAAIVDNHRVYACLVFNVNQVVKNQVRTESAERGDSCTFSLVPYLSQLERVYRRYFEFEEIRQHSKGAGRARSRMVFADGYKYDFTSLISDGSGIAQASIPWKVVDWLSCTPVSESNISDVARFCQLLKMTGPQHHQFAASVDCVLDRVFPGSQHRSDTKALKASQTLDEPCFGTTTQSGETSHSFHAKDSIDVIKRLGRKTSRMTSRPTPFKRRTTTM